MLQVGESVQLVVGYHQVLDDGEHLREDDGLFTIGVDLDAFSVNVSRPSVVSATMSAVANSDWDGIRHYLEIEALQPGETTVTVALGDSGSPFTYQSINVVVESEENAEPEKPEKPKGKLVQTSGGDYRYILIPAIVLVAAGALVLIFKDRLIRHKKV